MKSSIVLFLIVFVDLLGFGLVIPMLPVFARTLDASAAHVGILMFVYSFMQMVVSPYWGSLSDCWGRKPILILTVIGQALCYGAAGFSETFFELMLTRALAGLFAGNISTANAYMADLTGPADRAKGMGLLGAAFGMGFVLGPLFGGLLLGFGTAWPFWAASLICLTNAVVAIFVLKESSTFELRQKSRRRLSWAEFVGLATSRRLFPYIVAAFFLTIALTQLEVTFTFYAMDRFGLSAHEALYVLGAMGLMMAIVQGGFIGRLNKRYQEIRLALTGIVLLVAGLSLMIFVTHWSGLAAALMVLAVGYSLTNPCLMAMVSKSAEAQRQGASFGLYQSASSLARILGPISAGILYDHRQEYPYILSALLAMAAGCLLIPKLFPDS